MALCVVVGAGPVGRESARLLAAEGNEVRLVSRRGTAPTHDGVRGIALDASDSNELARVSDGAQAIFMCAMAAYDRWPTDFPPIMDGVATAAARVGARLVVLGNIYGYGESAGSPLVPSMPLAPTTVKGRVRTRMWERARAANVPAIEVRASDYLGEGAASLFTLMALPALLAGQPACMPGDVDTPHAWTFTKDVARTLVAASSYRGDWGRAFHVPSRHVTVRDLASRFAAHAGVAPAGVSALSREDLIAMARNDTLLREVIEMTYLFDRPCILDASETERLLGVSASSLDTMIRDTLRIAS